MTEIVAPKKPKKTSAPRGQKTFEMLLSRILSLQEEYQQIQQYLDDCLHYYSTKVNPEKKQLVLALSGFIKELFRHHETTKVGKKKKRVLGALILNKIEQILFLCDYKNLDPEVQVIYQALTGKSFDDNFRGDLERTKGEMKDFLAEHGVDIKFDNIDIHDDMDEIMRKMMEAMNDSFEKVQEKEKNSPKTKKELEKEQKSRQLKELQKKGVGSIYKQLAKALHPDLESCMEKKTEKENLMKRLTVAYKNNDLHGLLTLEMEWLSSHGEHSPVKSPADLKTYNSILKDQIKELETDQEVLPLHPKYFDIQPFIEQSLYNARHKIDCACEEYQGDVGHFNQWTQDLQGKAGRQVLDELLDIYQTPLPSAYEMPDKLFFELFANE